KVVQQFLKRTLGTALAVVSKKNCESTFTEKFNMIFRKQKTRESLRLASFFFSEDGGCDASDD
uniref:hypothetical protein n=1 Tax=Turicimonas muris TaxID=1796652 RepID=UPI0025B33D21